MYFIRDGSVVGVDWMDLWEGWRSFAVGRVWDVHVFEQVFEVELWLVGLDESVRESTF